MSKNVNYVTGAIIIQDDFINIQISHDGLTTTISQKHKNIFISNRELMILSHALLNVSLEKTLPKSKKFTVKLKHSPKIIIHVFNEQERFYVFEQESKAIIVGYMELGKIYRCLGEIAKNLLY